MLNILFISNDKRVSGLISYLQPLLKGALNCTSDFDHGLKDVFDKRPAIVFIQRKIDGVSGDVVAQHIKGLLRDNRPKIILLQDEAENLAMNSCYDDSIGFVLQEPEIYRLFCTYLRKFPEVQWVDDLPSDSAAAVKAKAEPADSASAEGKKIKQAAAPAAGAPASAQGKAPTETPTKAHSTKYTPTAGISAFEAPSSGRGSEEGGGEATAVSEQLRRPRWRLAAIASLGLALMLVTCVIASSLPGFGIRGWMTSDTPGTANTPAAQSRLVLHLPAVIVAQSVDAAFAAANPGWQRYRGERIDFRVFSPKGEIKVIQVIGQGQASLENAFLDAFLLDLLRSADRQITFTSRKDGYLVEKGKLTTSAEIIVYRQEKTDRIKGFVISFS